MDKNNQNKSPNGDYLQLLLEPIGTLSDSKVLTIPAKKLEQLGLNEYLVAGVTWTHNKEPITYGIFNYDQVMTICNKINTILNASIVNSEQRKAVGTLIEDIVRTRQMELASWTQRRTKEVQTPPGNDSTSFDGITIDEKSY